MPIKQDGTHYLVCTPGASPRYQNKFWKRLPPIPDNHSWIIPRLISPSLTL